MRNSRRIIVAFLMATALSGAIVKADQGMPGGPNRGSCAFLQGILYKVGAPGIVQAAFENVFGCDFS